MNLESDTFLYFLKIFMLNICIFYCFFKISNENKFDIKKVRIFIIYDFAISIICGYIRYTKNNFIMPILLCLAYGYFFEKLNKRGIGYSIIVTVISYAITFICNVISVMLLYLPYKILKVENYYAYLILLLLIQFLLIYFFFKIKRFRNGFTFLNKKVDNEITNIIVTNISIIILLIYCLFGSSVYEMKWNLFFSFLILSVTMIVVIKKMLTMYYKQQLLEKTVKEYEMEIEEKNNEILKYKNEKDEISRITHEFYNKQKAMELVVKENLNPNIDKKVRKKLSKNVLKMIHNLTEDYSNEFNVIKELPELDKTEIPEIDTMFKYMQSECAKNNIRFKLKIMGNIYPLVNNIISKNKLETLIGDHLRDAINAISKSNNENKEIFVIIGAKDEKYELCIYDTGIEFEIDTLLKLGKERVTTCKDIGGSGIGFLTTFETMKETKASLIISEKTPNDKRYYTKSVTIRFDDKNQYRVQSYRKEEIRKLDKERRIKLV